MQLEFGKMEHISLVRKNIAMVEIQEFMDDNYLKIMELVKVKINDYHKSICTECGNSCNCDSNDYRFKLTDIREGLLLDIDVRCQICSWQGNIVIEKDVLLTKEVISKNQSLFERIL